MNAVDAWLAQNATQCPLGKITKAQCQLNRARPTVAEHWRGEVHAEHNQMMLYRPGACEKCEEWKKLFGSFEKFAPRPKVKAKPWQSKNYADTHKPVVRLKGVRLKAEGTPAPPAAIPDRQIPAAPKVAPKREKTVQPSALGLTALSPQPQPAAPKVATAPDAPVPEKAPKRGLQPNSLQPSASSLQPSASNPKYPVFTPEMDAEIRRIYETGVGMGPVALYAPVRDLAKKFGMPRWRVSKRAFKLGVVASNHIKKKEPPWSAAELAILKEYAALTVERIQIHLKTAGFPRSRNGIKIKILRAVGRKPKQDYSSRRLARLFGIDDHSVTLWISKGLIKASKRGTKKSENQGGDTHVIAPADVRAFIVENVALIDFRKLDKFWLVELLAGPVSHNMPMSHNMGAAPCDMEAEASAPIANNDENPPVSASSEELLPTAKSSGGGRSSKHAIVKCRRCGRKRPNMGRGLCGQCYYLERKAEKEGHEKKNL